MQVSLITLIRFPMKLKEKQLLFSVKNSLNEVIVLQNSHIKLQSRHYSYNIFQKEVSGQITVYGMLMRPTGPMK